MSTPTPTQAQLEAAKHADWMQVVLNQGPPCFHLEGDTFCLRAERWQGHTDKDEWPEHRFVSLASLIASLTAATAAQEAELDEAIVEHGKASGFWGRMAAKAVQDRKRAEARLAAQEAEIASLNGRIESAIACAQRDCEVNPQFRGGLEPIIGILGASHG